LLLARSLGVETSRLPVMERASMRPDQAAAYAGMIESRAAGCPVAYLLGEKEFWSAPFVVDRRVLIPRPETELLVETAAELMEGSGRVAEIGTGSGCVIVALAKEVGGAGWLGVDVSAEALQVAEMNVTRHGLSGRITLRRSDLFEDMRLEDGPFDIIVSNPPYVPSGERDGLQREIREHEPWLALDGGEDGLDIVRKIIRLAPAHLRRGGHLLLEIGYGQAEEVMACVAADGSFGNIYSRRDLAGTIRVVAAERKGTCKE
jgi:release factor glutamine methyltransferase